MNQSRPTARRHREVNRKRINTTLLLLAVTAVIVLCGNVMFGKTFTATAHGNTSEEPVSYKYYKSIEIQSGDTLWDIANTYMSKDSSLTINEYISEVKEINSLTSDTIKESGFLTVPYYEAQFK